MKIRSSVFKTTRFGEDGKDTLGPIVIWIATHPGTITANNVHDASSDLSVEGAVVDFYEGAVEKLYGPHLRVTDDTNPIYSVRFFLIAALGMPIACAEREAADAHGSLTPASRYSSTGKNSDPSAKVFGVSYCHVLRGHHRRVSSEVLAHLPSVFDLPDSIDFSTVSMRSACVGGHGTDVDLLAWEIVELKVKPKSENPEEAAEDEAAV